MRAVSYALLMTLRDLDEESIAKFDKYLPYSYFFNTDVGNNLRIFKGQGINSSSNPHIYSIIVAILKSTQIHDEF